jgi:hypothetical protein
MGIKNTKKLAWKYVYLAAAATIAATFSASLWGQNAVMPASPAFQALPVALSSSSARALGEPNLSAIRIVDNDAYMKPLRPVSVRQEYSRRNWVLLVAASSAAATWDAYTTREAIQQGAIELDPMMKPFANSNSLYAAIQISPVVMDLVAYKMQRSENPVVHRMWWLPQALGTGVSLNAAVHNLGNTR